MSDAKRVGVGPGKTVPMPQYPYQRSDGKSGGAASQKVEAKAAAKISALQNFVLGS